MGRIAKAYTQEYVKSIEDKFYSMNPHVKEGGAFRFKDLVQVMRLIGLDPRNCDFPHWMLSNKVDRGVYKMPKKAPLIVGQVPVKAPKVVANKATKGKSTPSVNSRRWASGKAPLKASQISTVKLAKGDLNPGAYDDSVTYEDVASLRSEFGLGEFRNTLD